jgi:branched-subunit amino acid transport protein AzlD
MIPLLIVMTVIAASHRTFPFIFSKWLSKWTLLEKLAASLPLCISILLVAHLLEDVPFSQFPFGIPELGGLMTVLLVQIYFRTLLLSMGCGILIHQLLLHLL